MYMFLLSRFNLKRIESKTTEFCGAFVLSTCSWFLADIELLHRTHPTDRYMCTLCFETFSCASISTDDKD